MMKKEIEKAEGESSRLFLFWTLALGGPVVVLAPVFGLLDLKLVAAQWLTGLMALGLGLSYAAGGARPLHRFFLPSLVALSVSFLLAPLSQTASAAQTLGFILLAWLCAGLRLSDKEVGRLAGLWLAAACLVSLYALAQRAGFDPVPTFRSAQSADRAMATFGNANFLAAFLVLAWPLTFLLSPGLLVNAARILLLAALACTGSRAGFLAVAFQILLIGRQKWLVWPVLAAAALSFKIWMRPTMRFELWQESLSLWWRHPFTGWGPGSYPLAMQQSVSASLGQKLTAGNQFAEHPHNLFLFILCELGIVGLAAFCLTMTNVVRSSTAGNRSFRKVFLACAAGLLFENLFDRNFVLAGSAFFFWSIAGLLAGSGPLRQGPPARGTALTCATLLFAAAGWYGWSGFRSVRTYAQATAADFMQVEAGQAKAQEAEARAMLGFDTHDPMKWQSLGEGLAKQGEYAKAGEAYHEALKLAPNSVSAAINWGNCLFQQRRFPEAEGAYRRALVVNPASVDAHFDLGYCLFYQRRLKEAVDEFDTVLKLHPGDAKAVKMKEQILQ